MGYPTLGVVSPSSATWNNDTKLDDEAGNLEMLKSLRRNPVWMYTSVDESFTAVLRPPKAYWLRQKQNLSTQFWTALCRSEEEYLSNCRVENNGKVKI